MFKFLIDPDMMGEKPIAEALLQFSIKNRFIFISELRRALRAFNQTNGFVNEGYGWPAKCLSDFYIDYNPQTCTITVVLPDPIPFSERISEVLSSKSASEENATVIIGENTISIYVENYDFDKAADRMRWLTDFYRFIFVGTVFRGFGVLLDDYPELIEPDTKGWPSSFLKKQWIIHDLSSHGKNVFKLILPLPVGYTAWTKKENEHKNKEEKKMNMNPTKPICITDIETYNNRVVKMTFSDGTFTKAVCSENDKFDIDVGITICFLRKMLNSKNGRDEYAKFIRDAHKLMDAKAKAKAEAEKAKEDEKLRKERITKRKRQKADDERNARIDELTAAFVKANQLLDEFITGDYDDAK